MATVDSNDYGAAGRRARLLPLALRSPWVLSHGDVPEPLLHDASDSDYGSNGRVVSGHVLNPGKNSLLFGGAPTPSRSPSRGLGSRVVASGFNSSLFRR